MAYDLDFVEEADLKFHIKRFFLHPKAWVEPTNQIGFTLNWKTIKFKASSLSHIPKNRGVYAFTINPEFSGLFDTKYLCYVGKTNRTLYTRFSEYLDEENGKLKPRKKVFKMLKQYAGYLNFNYAPLSSSAEVDEAEDKLINTFVPHVNVVVKIAKIKPEYQYLYE